jgi:hypothetical protein
MRRSFADYTSIVQPARGDDIGGIHAYAKYGIANVAPPLAAEAAASTAIEPVAATLKACGSRTAGDRAWWPAGCCGARPLTLVNEWFPQVLRAFLRIG